MFLCRFSLLLLIFVFVLVFLSVSLSFSNLVSALLVSREILDGNTLTVDQNTISNWFLGFGAPPNTIERLNITGFLKKGSTLTIQNMNDDATSYKIYDILVNVFFCPGSALRILNVKAENSIRVYHNFNYVLIPSDSCQNMQQICGLPTTNNFDPSDDQYAVKINIRDSIVRQQLTDGARFTPYDPLFHLFYYSSQSLTPSLARGDWSALLPSGGPLQQVLLTPAQTMYETTAACLFNNSRIIAKFVNNQFITNQKTSDGILVAGLYSRSSESTNLFRNAGQPDKYKLGIFQIFRDFEFSSNQVRVQYDYCDDAENPAAPLPPAIIGNFFEFSYIYAFDPFAADESLRRMEYHLIEGTFEFTNNNALQTCPPYGSPNSNVHNPDSNRITQIGSLFSFYLLRRYVNSGIMKFDNNTFEANRVKEVIFLQGVNSMFREWETTSSPTVTTVTGKSYKFVPTSLSTSSYFFTEQQLQQDSTYLVSITSNTIIGQVNVLQRKYYTRIVFYMDHHVYLFTSSSSSPSTSNSIIINKRNLLLFQNNRINHTVPEIITQGAPTTLGQDEIAVGFALELPLVQRDTTTIADTFVFLDNLRTSPQNNYIQFPSKINNSIRRIDSVMKFLNNKINITGAESGVGITVEGSLMNVPIHLPSQLLFSQNLFVFKFTQLLFFHKDGLSFGRCPAWGIKIFQNDYYFNDPVEINNNNNNNNDFLSEMSDIILSQNELIGSARKLGHCRSNMFMGAMLSRIRYLNITGVLVNYASNHTGCEVVTLNIVGDSLANVISRDDQKGSMYFGDNRINNITVNSSDHDAIFMLMFNVTAAKQIVFSNTYFRSYTSGGNQLLFELIERAPIITPLFVVHNMTLVFVGVSNAGFSLNDAMMLIQRFELSDVNMSLDWRYSTQGDKNPSPLRFFGRWDGTEIVIRNFYFRMGLGFPVAMGMNTISLQGVCSLRLEGVVGIFTDGRYDAGQVAPAQSNGPPNKFLFPDGETWLIRSLVQLFVWEQRKTWFLEWTTDPSQIPTEPPPPPPGATQAQKDQQFAQYQAYLRYFKNASYATHLFYPSQYQTLRDNNQIPWQIGRTPIFGCTRKPENILKATGGVSSNVEDFSVNIELERVYAFHYPGSLNTFLGWSEGVLDKTGDITTINPVTNLKVLPAFGPTTQAPPATTRPPGSPQIGYINVSLRDCGSIGLNGSQYGDGDQEEQVLSELIFPASSNNGIIRPFNNGAVTQQQQSPSSSASSVPFPATNKQLDVVRHLLSVNSLNVVSSVIGALDSGEVTMLTFSGCFFRNDYAIPLVEYAKWPFPYPFLNNEPRPYGFDTFKRVIFKTANYFGNPSARRCNMFGRGGNPIFEKKQALISLGAGKSPVVPGGVKVESCMSASHSLSPDATSSKTISKIPPPTHSHSLSKQTITLTETLLYFPPPYSPFPTASAVSMSMATTAAVVFALTAPFGSGVGSAARMTATLALINSIVDGTCGQYDPDSDASNSPDPVESPLQMKISNSYALGTVIGNCLFSVAVVLVCSSGYWMYMKRQETKEKNERKQKARNGAELEEDHDQQHEGEKEEEDITNFSKNLTVSRLLSRSLSLAGLLVGSEILMYPTVTAALTLIVVRETAIFVKAISFIFALAILLSVGFWFYKCLFPKDKSEKFVLSKWKKALMDRQKLLSSSDDDNNNNNNNNNKNKNKNQKNGLNLRDLILEENDNEEMNDINNNLQNNSDDEEDAEDFASIYRRGHQQQQQQQQGSNNEEDNINNNNDDEDAELKRRSEERERMKKESSFIFMFCCPPRLLWRSMKSLLRVLTREEGEWIFWPYYQQQQKKTDNNNKKRNNKKIREVAFSSARRKELSSQFDFTLPLIEGFTERAPRFMMVEMGVQISLAFSTMVSVIIGSHYGQTQNACLVESILFILIHFSYFCAAVFVRPYQDLLSRLATPATTLVDMGVVVVAIVGSVPSVLSGLIVALGSMQLIFALTGLVQWLLAVGWPALRGFLRSTRGKRRNKSGKNTSKNNQNEESTVAATSSSFMMKRRNNTTNNSKKSNNDNNNKNNSNSNQLLLEEELVPVKRISKNNANTNNNKFSPSSSSSILRSPTTSSVNLLGINQQQQQQQQQQQLQQRTSTSRGSGSTKQENTKLPSSSSSPRRRNKNKTKQERETSLEKLHNRPTTVVTTSNDRNKIRSKEAQQQQQQRQRPSSSSTPSLSRVSSSSKVKSASSLAQNINNSNRRRSSYAKDQLL